MLGIQRIFHFSTLQDAGLALLTGGRRVVSRTRLGHWLRQAPAESVQRLLRKTEPRLPGRPEHLISLDEHAVPRFTRKFQLPKGFHSVRNKFMGVEMLYFSFHCGLRWLLGLVVTDGAGKFAQVGAALLAKLRPRMRGAQLRVVVDAGAAKNTNGLLTLADHRGKSPWRALRVVPRIAKSGASFPPSSGSAWRSLGPLPERCPRSST